MMSGLPLRKRAQRYLPRVERNEFFSRSVAEFSTLHHVSSRCDIFATVIPNQTRLESMETRHLEFSRYIKFEKIGAQKCLQTATWNLDQNQEKYEIGKLKE